MFRSAVVRVDDHARDLRSEVCVDGPAPRVARDRNGRVDAVRVVEASGGRHGERLLARVVRTRLGPFAAEGARGASLLWDSLQAALPGSSRLQSSSICE